MRSLILVSLAVLATSRPAHAGAIVLEVYTGSRPTDAAKLMSPMLDELANRGFVGGYDVVGRKFDSEVSAPQIVLQGLPLDFGDQIERGYKAWTAGKWDDAVKQLVPMINAAHANSGAFADSPAQRDLLLKATTILALSQQRMGDPSAARTTMTEIVRSFPGATVGKSMYGPDAAQLFEDARRDAKAGRGRMTVKVLDETAQVFINEHLEHTGTTAKDDLVPGDYRIVIRIGKQLSRTHHITLPPSGQATLTIDLAFDQAIHTAISWTGMTFATTAERERLEAQFAAQFATGIGASAVAVVGLDQVKGRPAIIGALVNLSTGQEIRRASVAADPEPPPDRIRALARFLAGDEPVKGVDVLVAGDPVGLTATATAPPPIPVTSAPHEDRPEAVQGSSHLWGGWRYLAATGALGALGTSAVLFAYDGRCSKTPPAGTQCRELYNNTAPAIITAVGGAAIAAVAIYLFVHHGDDTPTRTAFIAPTTGGAIAGFTTPF